MQRRGLLSLLYKLSGSITAASIVLSMGCPSGCGGLNPGAIPLDSSQIRDYGNEVKDDKAPIEAIVYGQLTPGAGDGGGAGGISLRFDNIIRDFRSLGELPSFYGFSDAQKADFQAWLDAFENDVKNKLSPGLVPASKSANGAKNLAAAVEPYVKTGGSLTVTIADGEAKISDSAKARYAVLSAELVKDFERLYQSAVDFAQGLVQYEASRELAKIKTALNRLQMNAGTIVPAADLDLAKANLVVALNKYNAERTFVGLMTTTDKVQASFTAANMELGAALGDVKINCIDRVVDPAHTANANSIYLDIDNAKKVLDRLVADYPAIEALKNPVGGDAKLLDLVSKAFSGSISAALGLADIDHETDINRLISLLSKHNLVVLAHDNSSPFIVEGLASAVVYKIAPNYGLGEVANVVGPHHDVLNKAKKDHNMNAVEFNDYLTSRGKLIREHQNKEGYKNVFVVFADEYAGADVSGMIQEFLKDGGKVVVVSADKTKYGNDAKVFSHGSLDVSEGVVLANAIIKKADPKISPVLISETLVKIYAAFGELTIGNLRPAVIDALGRINHTNGMNPDDVQQSVLAALAARRVATQLVNPSGILSDFDLATVQRNLRSNRSYYVDAARLGDLSLRATWVDEQKRNRAAADRLQQALNDANARNVRVTRLNVNYDGYKTGLLSVAGAKDIIKLVDKYRGDIENSRLDALGTLSSMENLLSNPGLCALAAQAPEWDGGHRSFLDTVSKQPYSDAEIKNPMSLFNVSARGVTAKVLTPTQRAAVSLNCFLTGPNKNTANDGQFTLKQKVAVIQKEINDITGDANDLADNMRIANINQIELSIKDLDERMKENIGLIPAHNLQYWKIRLSKLTVPTGASLAAGIANYGRDFDVKSYMKSYPVDNTNLEILPPQTISPGVVHNNLPRSFFGEYVGWGGAPWVSHDTKFDVKDILVAGNVWTIGKTYARSLNLYVGANVATNTLKAGINPIPADVGGTLYPAFIPAHDDFIKLNRRIWAWFLSRIVGKIDSPADEIPLTAAGELYEPAALFTNQKVFITSLFEKSQKLVQDANRYAIAQRALQILNEYKIMADLLYSLPPDDFTAFLSQPANNLTRFFSGTEALMSARAHVNSIQNDTRVNINANWVPNFFPVDVNNVLPGSLNPVKFAGAVIPAGGENGRLAPIWVDLVLAAARIEALKAEVQQRILLVNP